MNLNKYKNGIYRLNWDLTMASFPLESLGVRFWTVWQIQSAAPQTPWLRGNGSTTHTHREKCLHLTPCVFCPGQCDGRCSLIKAEAYCPLDWAWDISRGKRGRVIKEITGEWVDSYSVMFSESGFSVNVSLSECKSERLLMMNVCIAQYSEWNKNSVEYVKPDSNTYFQICIKLNVDTLRYVYITIWLKLKLGRQQLQYLY